MDAAITFVCLADNQVAVHRQVLSLPPETYRRQAFHLLREHAAAAAVEVWRDDALWEVIARDGVRAIRPAPARAAREMDLVSKPSDNPSHDA
ncbi:hypothetical protein [Caulobacter segnis]|uniref:hypothetical protein n=1 Tax=Caulobacter segnis TaxID=88688 RepID=UPI002857D00D|nr:hypothetical protein [Caulobacter segnis]MDR6624512.1 hypothetical protein [Caulobacter segnis]